MTTTSPLLEALRHIHTNGPASPEYGVLWNVRQLTNKDSAVEIQLLQLLRQYYSTAYSSLPKDPTGWDSPRRIALLNWLIEQLEQEEQHG